MLTANADDAADLAQEALLKLSFAWRRVRNKDDPEGYVRTIMARQHVSWWRRRREQLTDEVPSPVRDEHDLREVWQRLRALPPKQRAVLVLRYYEQLAPALSLLTGPGRRGEGRGRVSDFAGPLQGRCSETLRV